MASLIENLNDINDIKLEIKEILNTNSYVFSEYPDLISAAIAGGGGITPSGTYTINSNGTYDITTYAYAYVSISSGAGITISSASIATDMQYPSMNAMTEGVDSFSYTFSDSDVYSGTLNVYLEAYIGANSYYTGGFHTVGPVSADGNYSESESCNMESSTSGFTFNWSNYGMDWTGDISNVTVSISKNVGMNGFVIGIQYTISNYQEITPGPTPTEKNGRYLVTFGDPMAPTEVYEQFSMNPMDGSYDVNSVYGGLCEIRDYSMDVLTDTWKPSIDTILDPLNNIDFNSSVELGNASTGNLTISSGYNLHMEVQNDHPYIWYYNGGGSSSSESGSSSEGEITGDSWMFSNSDAAEIMSSDGDTQFENPNTGMMETAVIHGFYNVPLNSFFGQGGDDTDEVVHPFTITRNGMDTLYTNGNFYAAASDIIPGDNDYIKEASFNPMDYQTSPIPITSDYQTLPMNVNVIVYEVAGAMAGDINYFLRVQLNYAS